MDFLPNLLYSNKKSQAKITLKINIKYNTWIDEDDRSMSISPTESNSLLILNFLYTRINYFFRFLHIWIVNSYNWTQWYYYVILNTILYNIDIIYWNWIHNQLIWPTKYSQNLRSERNKRKKKQMQKKIFKMKILNSHICLTWMKIFNNKY